MSTVVLARPADPEMPLAVCLDRLEAIAREMSRELDLERAVGLWKEGRALHARAIAILTSIRAEIEEIDGVPPENAPTAAVSPDADPSACPFDTLDDGIDLR